MINSVKTFACSQYTTLTKANPNLDGSGAINTVIVAKGNGTIINSVVIKAVGSNSLGIVRLFIFDGINNYLIREIMIGAVTQSSTVPSYFQRIEIDLLLEDKYELRASTEFDDEFNVLAFGQYWESCPC